MLTAVRATHEGESKLMDASVFIGTHQRKAGELPHLCQGREDQDGVCWISPVVAIGNPGLNITDLFGGPANLLRVRIRS